MDSHKRAFGSLWGATLPTCLPAMVAACACMVTGCSGVAGGMAGAALGGAVMGSAIAPNPFEWPFAEDSRVLALDCGGRRVVLEVREATAWLFLPSETLELTRIFSEPLQYGRGQWLPMNPVDIQVSGEPGRHKFDPQVFVTIDNVTRLESVVLQEGETRIDCQVNRPESRFEAAKLGGADFRALGNEPGWELVIWRDRMRLTYDYGASDFEVPLAGEPEILEDETGSRFRGQVDGRVLEALLQRGPCHDSMSDQVFETRVRISLDGRNFTGCGKALH